MPERFECTTLVKKALYKYSSFAFLFVIGFSHFYRDDCERQSDRQRDRQTLLLCL